MLRLVVNELHRLLCSEDFVKFKVSKLLDLCFHRLRLDELTIYFSYLPFEKDMWINMTR